MGKTKLATFNIEPELWESFKQWASGKDSNATIELTQFILRALGRIDNSLDEIQAQYIDKRLAQHLNDIDTDIDEKIEKVLKKKLGEGENIKFVQPGANNSSVLFKLPFFSLD